ncbi:MAG: GGDEF domain-containing protein [Oscillospiraceae bacterium]|nr:GGDEF domain-containing protein [Oscillospiraceae bacterium]
MSTAYLTALEGFIRKLQQLPYADFEQTSEAMAELCRVLRLGKVEVITYENEASERLGLSSSKCFYDSGKACENGSVSRRITSVDDTITVYRICSIEGEPEWTEEERNRVNTFIAVLSTFSEKFRLSKLAHHMTYYDNGLDMYNLKQFMKCAHILCKSGRIGDFAAVRFNLKHFSVVNQYVGRDTGTLIMKKFIGLIDDLIDDEDELICRIGGDIFLTLIKREKLHSVIGILSGTDIVYNEALGEHILITATIGVYDIENTDKIILPTDIMDRVSLAAQIAKNSPQTDIVFFDDALLERNKHKNEISANFPQAIKNREFLVYYQPKVNIGSRRVAGAEALCRWMHEGRLVPPGEFIPILEQGRDICKLDFYMLDSVCRDIRRWLDNGMNVVRISVNLSRLNLTSGDLMNNIIEIIDRNNVPHKYIEIELTETTTDVEFKDLKRIIAGLQQAGISTSVDDFGIGYSSLNLIKELPWNVLKLDKSLLPEKIDESIAQKGIMFKHTVAMAQEMGLECISEGVETEEQVQILAENKCNIAQGFYFDRPLPVEEFEKRLDINYVYDR